MPELRKVTCTHHTLEYILTRKPVKNINLRIKLDGKIYVSAHKRVKAEYIDYFIKGQQNYIIKAMDKYDELRKHVQAPKQYITGETFEILGRPLQLKVSEGKEESITTAGDNIFLTVKDITNQKRKEKLMKDWLKELQIEIFQQISKEIYQIFKKYDIDYPLIKNRNMKSKWGSCQPQRGIITLNSRLIEAPRNCIEYVVLHEFAHFIHPNHSRKFHDFVTMLMPDWKERKKELGKRL